MADIQQRQDADHQHDSEEALTSSAVVPAWTSGGTTAALSVSRTAYSKKAVLAAAYKLSDRCAVLVDTEGEDRWLLYVVTKPGTEAQAILPFLIRELGDQALRAALETEFGAVRTLIVAQAFSEGNLLDPTRDDVDLDADPRGTEQRR